MANMVHAQETFKKGTVLDSIAVSNSNGETFTLYLPESYSVKKLNPIVFIFEPAARGFIGISPFLEASEKYGYVLVCSNNARNGPYDRNFDIANRLFDHIFANFKIKEDEMYISGLSGGSRLATAIASLTDRFAGVVACGAGFSHIQEHMPSTQNFVYAGLCGDRDMNYKEMLGNVDYFGLIKFNSTLITFGGEHTWPPQSQILRAFDWLNTKKLIKNNPSRLDDILLKYQSDYKTTKEFEKKGAYLFASEAYDRMIQTYDKVIKSDSLKEQHQELKKSKSYIKQKKSLTAALELETELKKKLDPRLLRDLEDVGRANFKWWNKEVEKLNKLRENGDAEIKKMVYRLKFGLFVRVYSRKNKLLYNSTPEQAKLVDDFIQLFYPKK